MRRVLLLCLLLRPVPAQILVNTYAGGAVPSGGSAQIALLDKVAGVAWDHSGNLVFCDPVNNVIREITAAGTIVTIAGNGMGTFSGDGGPALSAALSSPASPVFDTSGNLYFADAGNYRIRKIDTNSIVTTVAGNGLPSLAGMDRAGPVASISITPMNIAIDPSSNVYFTSTQSAGYWIGKVTPAGQVEWVAGTGAEVCYLCAGGDGGPATAATISGPEAIAADPSGNIYFIDELGSELRKISTIGIISTLVAPTYPPETPQPDDEFSGLATDASGNLYASYELAGNYEVLRFGPSGNQTVVSTIQSQALALDAQGNIGFSLCSTTCQIGELTAQGAVQSLAGANPQPAPDGTPLAQAWFFSPNSLAFDPSGNLFISDVGACQIRKISAGGVLSTIAGSGVCGATYPSGSPNTTDLFPPYAIAVDSQDNIWIADQFTDLFMIAQDGTMTQSPVRGPVIGGGSWLAFDSQDRLYVGALGSLVRILPDQTVQTILSPSANQSTPQVTGIAKDPSGTIYFGTNSGVYRVNDDGSYTQVAGNPASGLFAVDAAGNIWAGTHVTSSAGTAVLGESLVSIFGDGGPAASAGFNTIADAFSPSGTLYLLDGNRIRVLTGSGPLQAPSIAQGGVVNAASYAAGPIAPGELLSIFGSNFGTTTVQVNAAINNSIPTALGSTRVLFNGMPGAISAIAPNQINVFVPYYHSFTPGTSAQVQVQVDDAISIPVTLTFTDSAPGILTALGSGTGQGSILNQDASVNSASNPAAPGSIISIFGTGEGVISPQMSTGNLVLSTPYPLPADHASVTVGGVAAQVAYAGEAPTLPAGVFQINAQIPPGTPSGNVPVSVSFGSNNSGTQVTVAVQ